MIGAIIGDVVGSRFEFNNIKSKSFEFINKYSTFTDDTVLTVAIIDWLLHAEIKSEIFAKKYLQKWARMYPHAGYGGMFRRWIYSNNPEPYNSYGNGAAMRISPVAWVSDDIVETRLLSDIATGVTHNHKEGYKGAMVVSSCIWMARKGSSKEEIKQFVEKYYDLQFDYEDLRKNYRFDETCQNSVPQAIYCFLISDSFEDCLRTTISIGGDSDTLAAISCSIAEAYYGVPEEIEKEVRKLLTPEMLFVIDEFEEKYKSNRKE